MPAGYNTDGQIYDFIEEMLSADDNDYTADLITLAYGGYQAHKLAWARETEKVTGKPPTPKQQEVWIESLATETIRMTTENAAKLFENLVEDMVNELLPDLEAQVQATSIENELKHLNVKYGQLKSNTEKVSIKQILSNVGSGIAASIVMIAIFVLIFQFQDQTGGSGVPERVVEKDKDANGETDDEGKVATPG